MGEPYTTSTALLEALTEAGVRYLFANLGSDHTGIIEAYARGGGRFPELILCPHESVALSAAHGYTQVSGEAQAVLVHTDCGTQNLGGAMHNASRGRIPVLIFAGLTPATLNGELPGSRTEFIHWLQDTADQRGLVRGYVKSEQEIRTGANVKQLVHRALQIARSDPPGPAYLTGTREIMEQLADPESDLGPWFGQVAPCALAAPVVDEIVSALEDATSPLIVTSYLGREPLAVGELVRVAELAGAGVLESVPNRVNFPPEHPLHGGYLWHTPRAEPLPQADVILVIGSDVPWIPTVNRPSDSARIFVVDADPLKEQLPLWAVPAVRYARADAGLALRQIAQRLAERGRLSPSVVASRTAARAEAHSARLAEYAVREAKPDDGTISPAYAVACLRDVLGSDAIVLTEAVSGYQIVSEHLRASRPGSLFGSGGGSLGWSGGAAVGAKLAAPDKTVVSIVGDGSYLFGVPSVVHWMARRYGAPSLTVILNNQGWRTPLLSTLAVHPDGAAARKFAASFAPAADLPGIAAAAGDAVPLTVSDADALPVTLASALAQVQVGRSAVVSIELPPVGGSG
ncbi:MAG TPA: thiamine pyrophosphate-requiring protein [Streptosporangiaceae bacterium]|nr:thiamine pyrophosphate-requiring protein [Streptosporangiaceae bacterium]